MKPQKIILILTGVFVIGSSTVAGSRYEDIIKDTTEYKKVTEGEAEQKEKCHKCGSGYYYPSVPVYHDHYYGPEVSNHYSSGPAPSSRTGTAYVGVAVGASSFDYEDIEDGDATQLYLGYRGWSRLGYEVVLLDTGNAEVIGLNDIQLDVNAVNLGLTLNSATNHQEPLNAYLSGGIYLADTTLIGPVASVSEGSTGFTAGAGLELSLNEYFKLRADARVLFDVEDFANDESISMLSIGGQFNF